ncbi:MAG: C40 family peptidase [Cocleimonas sp.]|nr:C40 family peptidase [Cocleimonas sp.]
MHLINWAYTTTFCVFFSLPNHNLAAQENNSRQQQIDIEILEQAYQQLVLGHNVKKKQVQTQQDKLKKQVTLIAKKQLKIRYRWGGASPRRGFDCSGLIQYSFKKANISLPRTAASQYKKTKRISLTQLQIGDLIFFHTRQRKRTRVNHVGLYLGNNTFIHAPRKGKRVTIAKLNRYWKGKVVGAGRI